MNKLTENVKLNYPRWILIVTVMMVAILEVLDTTIVNVALPAMMPALGADQETITWILTSYVVASAIVLPLTGFLAGRLGQKRLLLTAILGFMVSSFFCGISDSLGMMIFFRMVQGACGASLIPLSQAIIRQNYPLEEQGKAMAIWGIGILAAPVLGPVIGGYITENSSWRWIFYVNVPICILALTLTWFFVQRRPTHNQSIDKLGLIFMVIGVSSLQFFLDQGNINDWFDSFGILLLAISSVVFISLTLYRCLTFNNPIIKLKLYRDRNFAICSMLIAAYAGCFFSVLVFEPILLINIFKYSIIHAGETTALGGIASALGMGISAVLLKRMNIKLILFIGLVLSSMGMWELGSLNLDTSQFYFVWLNALLGLGVGLFMVPVSLYSIATLPAENLTEGAGLYTYSRMLGTSIGIALFTTLFTRHVQINWYHLVGNISDLNPNLNLWLNAAQMNLNEPQTPMILSNMLSQHATMVAFNFIAQTSAVIFIMLIPLTLGLKTVHITGSLGDAH